MTDLSDVISVLPRLTKQELKTVQVTIEHLLGPSAALLDAELFQVVLTSLGVSGSPTMFMKTQNYKTWLKNQPAVDALIKKIVGNEKLKFIVILNLKRFLVGLLIEELKQRRLPLTMRSVAAHLAFIEDVFNKEFPNYLASGMGGLVLKQLNNGG